MEGTKREMGMLLAENRGRSFARRTTEEEDDDDDARSVMTVMDNREEDDLRRAGKREVNGHGYGDGNGDRSEGDDGEPTADSLQEMSNRNQELASRVQTLSVELSQATQLSQHLQAQHDEAMAALGTLSTRIGSLETGLKGRIAEAVSESDRKWETWRTHVEDGWKKERESWEAERERLRSVVRDWEEASRRANEEVEDRALNERLSGEELEFSDEDAELERSAAGVVGGKIRGGGRGGRKTKRRRPSHKTSLALRALRDVSGMEGQSTPTQQAVPLRPEDGERTAQPEKEGDEGSASGGSDESTQSGKESVDTLRDRDAGGKRVSAQRVDSRPKNVSTGRFEVGVWCAGIRDKDKS
jgi:hypothetical protein